MTNASLLSDSQDSTSSVTESKDMGSNPSFQGSSQKSSEEQDSSFPPSKEDCYYDELYERKGMDEGQYKHCRNMRNMGIAQIVIGFACICIAIPLTVEMERTSAGSGIWCSVFFILMGGLDYTAAQMKRPFRVMLAFGITCIYFGLLMLSIEIVELYIVHIDRNFSIASFMLHSVLCLLAVVEIGLSTTIIVFCHKHNATQVKQVSFRRDYSHSTATSIVRVLIERDM